MAITRTPIIDDDGTGTTGTVIDNAWKTEFYNQIDGALGSAPFRLGTGSCPVALASTTYNNFAPAGGTAAIVWDLSPAGPCDITGIVAEATHTQHLLINVGGYPITFYNQHTNSLAANRFIGPGFANYTLAAWGSIWMLYHGGYTSWLLQKA